MNILTFDRNWKKNIVFCMVDNIKNYQSDIRLLMKNQADGVLANLYNKGYKVLQWFNEDELLNEASKTNCKYALVFSTGTEFINGSAFFDNIENLLEKNFFIAGHILDRGDAYYELHHQCYLINLDYFKKLGNPKVGQQHLGHRHKQLVPWRSKENYHDGYTPIWVSAGDDNKFYEHKCHGWNILSCAFEQDLPVLVFDDSIRNNKIHFYPENPEDFYKKLSWAYRRFNYCQNDFIHTGATETVDIKIKYQQIITPASSDWYKDYIEGPGKVIYYDYNEKSLEYWKANHPKLDNIQFHFVKCNLLDGDDFLNVVDTNLKTFVNLSNIFNYEGTTFFYSQYYRELKEKELIEKIKALIADVKIYQSLSARLFDTIPTWHY